VTAILPGATIGILGGGQLGRMTAMAARSLGYHIWTLDPDPSCAARFVVERCITANFDDEVAAAYLAHNCDVVTLEIETIAQKSLAAAAKHAPLRPSAEILGIIQDRGAQKAWLSRQGFPLGAWGAAHSVEELTTQLQHLGECFVKSCHGGYDGRSQAQVDKPSEAAATWQLLGSTPVVVEKKVELKAELSVLVARSPSGEIAVYPPALNHHEQRILAWSVLPGPFDAHIVTRAQEIARELAQKLRVEGLVVIELFLTDKNELLVNELAPRPHNSFHSTEVACVTSQFEQAVRAVCDLPLGSTEIVRPAAIANLLGDLWQGAPPAFDRALALPGVRVHLYGKRQARPGRKMGHLSATARTPDEAIATVRAALAALQRGSAP
jgi:5-(carboxyamino)imidazole ribonucleotide synthase